MTVTSQQIADAAGVSRATVDRALKDRGRVKPEVAERIRNIARDMGYHPNQAARALALARNPVRIGVIIQSACTPFMQEVLKGVQEGRKEAERLGGKVEVCLIDGVNPVEVAECMDQLREHGCNGIALVPAYERRIREKINQFTEEYNIPIVTFNSDLADCRRICFIGQDNLKSGRVAAGLLAESIMSGGQVAVITGSASNPALNSRTKGFRGELAGIRPDIQLLETRMTEDCNEASEKVASELLRDYPGLGGLYISSPAVTGICRALQQAGLEQQVKVVANDVTEANIGSIKQGILNFLIGQGAYVQGYRPIMVLFRYLVNDAVPEAEYDYTDIIIKTRYNL